MSAADALGVLNHTVGRTLPAGFTVSLTGDASGDGAVTAADALVILSFAVGRDVSQFPVGQALDASVAVLRGPGVRGDPASGTLLMSAGRTVKYRFVLEPGFEELQVTLDGAAVPDSGTVRASAAHLLVASASPVVVVPPADAPLVAEVRAMLSAADPVVRYQALVDRMATLPLSEAERQLRVASRSALHGVRDSAAIRRFNEALAGRFFEVTGDQALRAASAAAGGESPVAGNLPSTLLYINGIHSDAFASLSTTVRVAALAEERLGWTFGGGSAHHFGRFYNQTWADSPHAGGFQCLAWWQNGGWSVLESAGMQDWYRRCLGEVDILEAAGQWIDGHFQRSGLLDADARRFAMRVQSEIRQGRSVLIVAHSQGNLMTQEALETLPASALRCVAVVSLAPPATDGWPDERLAAHGSIFAKGQLTQDILLGLLYGLRGKVPAAEMIETDTTRRSDAEVSILAALFGGHRAYNPVIAAATLYNDLELHGANSSYLAGDATRTRTAALIGSSDNALNESCADSMAMAPRSGIVQIDSSITLTAEVFNPLGEKLAAPRVEWRSANPSRATVDADGRVTARDTGRVWIHAAHGDRARDSVQIRIGNPTFGRIAAGFVHTCVLDTAGSAYCWGAGIDGRLGTGNESDSPVPVPVAANQSFTSISSLNWHTCGVTVAAHLYCWGANRDGQIGTGDTVDALGPVPVSGGRYASVSVGGYHTCALTTIGVTQCWGLNREGQVGTGDTSRVTTPSLAAGGMQFTTVAAGGFATCGLHSSGQAYCWGYAGEQWREFDPRFRVFSPTVVAGAPPLVSLSNGGHHTCGLTSSGRAYCWGTNLDGRLGNGGTEFSTSATPVDTEERFASISAGPYHTCGLTAGGMAFCWGPNEQGQLGTGDFIPRAKPAEVASSIRFRAISAGGYHTCALAVGGQIYCWGYNRHGVIGVTESLKVPVPTLLPFNRAANGPDREPSLTVHPMHLPDVLPVPWSTLE